MLPDDFSRRKNGERNWSVDDSTMFMAPLRKRQLISSSHCTASDKDRFGSSRWDLVGGGEEKGILYPRIALSTTGSNVSLTQLWAKSASRPAVLTIVSGSGSESETSGSGSLCGAPLHGEPTKRFGVQGLSCFSLSSVKVGSAASSVVA